MVAQPRSRPAHCRVRAQKSPECALTCGSSTVARVRAPRGTHGTPRRGVRHGRGAGPIRRHRPLSGPRGAPWRALCPPTGRARFRVLGALRPLPFCATRATLCGACARGLVSERSRRAARLPCTMVWSVGSSLSAFVKALVGILSTRVTTPSPVPISLGSIVARYFGTCHLGITASAFHADFIMAVVAHVHQIRSYL